MNQFSFNLDQNYLQHDKFGAHYSKNWDKKKQDEYNAWYYKTHKDLIKRKKHKYEVDSEGRSKRKAAMDAAADKYRSRSELANWYESKGDHDHANSQRIYRDYVDNDLQEAGKRNRNAVRNYNKWLQNNKDSIVNRVGYDLSNILNRLKHTRISIQTYWKD